jgi:hypothetical protein
MTAKAAFPAAWKEAGKAGFLQKLRQKSSERRLTQSRYSIWRRVKRIEAQFHFVDGTEAEAEPPC